MQTVVTEPGATAFQARGVGEDGTGAGASSASTAPDVRGAWRAPMPTDRIADRLAPIAGDRRAASTVP